MYRIAVLPGDRIGVEIVPEAVKALQAIGKKCGHQFQFTEALIGGAAYDAVGHPLLRLPWRSAANQTLSCWGPSAVPSGMICPSTCGRR